MKSSVRLIDREVAPEDSELLFAFDQFTPEDWSIVRGAGEWRMENGSLQGVWHDDGRGRHGQIFYRYPVAGDILLEFDARLLPPSRHDLIWLWQTSFEEKPWGEGYLGCIGGWYGDYVGIEKLPRFRPSLFGVWRPLVSGETVHVLSGTVGGDAFVALNGELVSFFADPAPPAADKPGYFGFGIYQSAAEYRNLRVYRPKPRPVTVGY